MKKKRTATTHASRKSATGIDKWSLRLYVAGKTPNSALAIKNLKHMCEEQLQGKYHIEVVDLSRNPRLARSDQILAIPTLVRKLPLPVKSIVGDLSDAECVLVGLGLVPRIAAKKIAVVQLAR